MSKALKNNNGNIMIFCPGCKYTHVLNVNPDNGRPMWDFNGDYDKPTFSPSLLVRTGHHVPGQPKAEDCDACKECAAEGVPTFCSICHSYIKDGNIQFLSDSTHELSGQTVPLGDVHGNV
jgi:hypothetical protein